ncbi:MAG TPA: hypothetical protein VGF75_05095 [Candidatus Saccharimonadales bacterium]
MSKTPEFQRAKFVVEVNAKKQAIGDARTLEPDRIDDALEPAAPVEMIPTLLSWVRGVKGEMIFRGISQIDYRLLTNEDKVELQNYWITRYFEVVKEKLIERVKGNSI